MGAYVGASYAASLSVERTYQMAKRFSILSRWWNYLTDATIPFLSCTSGSHFTEIVSSTMGTALDSSDLRLAYYCNATNLSNMAQALTLLPHARPVWEMVRASMGLPILIPPYAIQGQGDVLIDGCFAGNVPVMPAFTLGAEIVLAFNVSVTTGSPPPQQIDRSVSGWPGFVYWIRGCCGRRRRHKDGSEGLDDQARIITLAGKPLGWLSMLEQLAFSSNDSEIAAIEKIPECLYMSQPVGFIGALAMDKIDLARNIGYENAKAWLKQLKADGKFDHLAVRKRFAYEAGRTSRETTN